MEKFNHLKIQYCITHPRLRPVGNFGFVYDMDDYCGCGKQYKEHKYWQEWMVKSNYNEIIKTNEQTH